MAANRGVFAAVSGTHVFLGYGCLVGPDVLWIAGTKREAEAYAAAFTYMARRLGEAW